ncbi:MAG: PHP domain-containing protein, partial [Clostridia bacterium]|nr:PHP domain-containing protein [Clostridia bacterium]
MEPNLIENSLFANNSLPDEVKDFLQRITISKVNVSQVHNTWEIYFCCPELPSFSLLDNCRQSIAKLLPEVNKIILKPKINYSSLQAFLKDNWNNFLSFLYAKYPSAQGWMANSYWRLNEKENMLEIFLGSQLGVKYLTKHGCIKFMEELLAIFTEYKPMISLKFDENIEPVPLNKEETPDTTAEKSLSNNTSIANNDKEVVSKSNNEEIILGKKIKGEIKKIKDVIEEEPNLIICGKAFDIEIKQLKTGRAILVFNLTDLTDSITCKIIKEQNEIEEIAEKISSCPGLMVKGTAQIDRFSQELNLMVQDINSFEIKTRTDQAPEKRIELHLHTKMSSMDGVSSIKDLVKMAAGWGHQA